MKSAATIEVKQRDGAWFATHKTCGWKIACRDEDFARELAAEHRCPASNSYAREWNAHQPINVESAATTERKRVYMVKRTLVERCFYDPDEIRREFGGPDEGESWEDFVVRVFERFDGSIYGDEFFPGDASPEVGTELEERWDDE